MASSPRLIAEIGGACVASAAEIAHVARQEMVTRTPRIVPRSLQVHRLLLDPAFRSIGANTVTVGAMPGPPALERSGDPEARGR